MSIRLSIRLSIRVWWRFANKVKRFLFSVCYMQCTRFLLISRKKSFSLDTGKNLPVIRIGGPTKFKLALLVVNIGATWDNFQPQSHNTKAANPKKFLNFSKKMFCYVSRENFPAPNLKHFLHFSPKEFS